MKRFNENEADYQNWLTTYNVTNKVLKEIDQTYTELYDDLFNNSENLSSHKDKWILFKVDSNSFKDLFDDLSQINFVSKDFTLTNFKLEKDDPNNPVYSADKTATSDIIGRDGKTVMQPNGEIRRAKNLSLSTLRSQLTDKYIKWTKEPELYYYYIKITRDIKEITHMSTDKAWTSCMRIYQNDEGGNIHKIIKSIKKGLLVAYTYKLSEDDLDLIDNSDKQFGENAVSRISINPYQSNTKFLYLKAMKRYAGNNYLANEPFDLQEEVQDYLDKHFNFGVLDSEDIFYADSDFYNDLNLDEIGNNPFTMIRKKDINGLKKYINDGGNLKIMNIDYNLLEYAIYSRNEDIINLIKKYIPLTISNKTLDYIITEEIKRLGNNADLNHLNVSDVTNMYMLFYGSEFNGDISKWDTSKVTNMNGLFYGSEFNGDISKWDTSKVTNMSNMFENSPLQDNPPKWFKSQIYNI